MFMPSPLISVDELILQSDASPCLVDCRFSLGDPDQGRREFEAGHIPGSVYAHLDDDLSAPVQPGVTGRHPLPDPDRFARTLGRWGIGPETLVVAYDAGPGAFASRLWWLLRWVGHTRVRVLDGGFAAWSKLGDAEKAAFSDGLQQDGKAVDSAAVSASSGSFATRGWASVETSAAPYPVRPQAGMVASAEEVLRGVDDPSRRIIDARERIRFLGLEEPIDPVAGRIPGALSAPFPENVGPDGRFRDPGSLRDRFGPLLDGTDAEHAIMYCGSGVTAAHNLLAMEIAGFEGALLYAGSWSEWITDPARPIERG